MLDTMADASMIPESGTGIEMPFDGNAVQSPVDAYLPPPPINPATALSSLTEAQKEALCDWQASGTGGYQQRLDCGSAGEVFTGTQKECIELDFYGVCPDVTVAQFEACVNVLFLSGGCLTKFQVQNAR
jgi:hypothetical protein